MAAPRIIDVPESPRFAALKDGERFTIAGVRMRRDGKVSTRCKPGNETVFIARVRASNSNG